MIMQTSLGNVSELKRKSVSGFKKTKTEPTSFIKKKKISLKDDLYITLTFEEPPLFRMSTVCRSSPAGSSVFHSKTMSTLASC